MLLVTPSTAPKSGFRSGRYGDVTVIALAPPPPLAPDVPDVPEAGAISPGDAALWPVPPLAEFGTVASRSWIADATSSGTAAFESTLEATGVNESTMALSYQ
jgi:hypothetical protein